MRRHRKPFKYYLYMFLFSVVLVIVYTLYNVIRGTVDMNQMVVTWFFPFLFIGLYYGSDTLLDKLSKKKNKINYEANFLEAIGESMRKSDEFLIEDYRKLRLNDKFQKAVKDAYYIYENGENEVYNFQRIEKRFRNNTVEHKAILFVISYVKENQKIEETK